ncbi:hypothetical protein [Terriglobus sp. RCC_193]|uniref:HORMA-1 domain-containing protein n=1 Tax=Terriglobus sp. RCC_193 TaxID=3239218 RepID=UPI0035232288
MGTASTTGSLTYSTVDIEKVVRKVTTDLKMIAQSTSAITETLAQTYGEDIELLAKNGYLESVDLTLLTGGENGTEVKATKYIVNTAAGDLTSSRPGGVLWPRVANPYLRIILTYTSSYDSAARNTMSSRLNVAWQPTSVSTSHVGLPQSGGRDYASNGWGMQRKDFGA